jgi:phosphoglucomutase
VFSTEFSKLTVKLNSPFTDQKPGTSGLRKSTLQFEEDHYLESFIESILCSLPGVKGGVLVVGGDGRYGNKRAIDIIIRMAAANGIKKVITTVDGILSTPAASNLIRINKAIGGIILSASHNPGGLEGDFGVKLNGSNGGPASEALTDQIYNYSKNLKEYKIIKCQSNNSYSLGTYKLASTTVEIIDGIEDYIDLMKKIFDFDLISSYINKDFRIVFDALNAVTGPYAKRLFVDHLGANSETVRNGIPLEDFGGLHPDPNLTYAKDLADLLLKGNLFSFGAACDGDGDRNMILGRGCFVNPSDSLAILAANYDCVPGYAKGLSGVARSMPTSSAVDVVAKHLGINCFETPTGWKFFGNLLDANKITLCGEESFGTGSDHVREKDGLWAVLFWLQILASKKKSVSEIMKNHWLSFGRHYYSRHDYESISSEVANSLYSRLSNMLPTLIDQSFAGRIVKNADDFSYTDPIDGSITLNQGLRILLDDGSRVLVRLSGTGTQGATLRVYFESFVPSDGDINQDPQLALDPLIKSIDSLAEISKRTGMSAPTVIT